MSVWILHLDMDRCTIKQKEAETKQNYAQERILWYRERHEKTSKESISNRMLKTHSSKVIWSCYVKKIYHLAERYSKNLRYWGFEEKITLLMITFRGGTKGLSH